MAICGYVLQGLTRGTGVHEGLQYESLLQVNAEKAEKDVAEGKGDHTMFHGKAEVDYQGESRPWVVCFGVVG